MHLTALHLGGNRLSGPIPAWLGDLADLEFLNLADNQFSGRIPPELGDLTGLDLLDLSDNQLSGPVPEAVSELPWNSVGGYTFERDWWMNLHLDCLWPFP